MYTYWSSREELLEEALAIGQESVVFREKALSEVGPGSSSMDRILTAVNEHVEAVADDSDFTRAASGNINQIPEENRERHRRAQGKCIDLWRNLVLELDAAGDLRDDISPEYAAMLIVGSLNSPAMFENWDRSRFGSLVQTMRQFVARALSGDVRAEVITVDCGRPSQDIR